MLRAAAKDPTIEFLTQLWDNSIRRRVSASKARIESSLKRS